MTTRVHGEIDLRFTDGAEGALLMRDTGELAGFSWLPSAAGVLVSAGTDQAPVFRPLGAGDLPVISWTVITDTPTTIAGYGITDPIVLTSGSYADPAWITSLAWSKMTSTPTTRAGYGITDAQPLSVKLSAFDALANAAGALMNDGSGALAWSMTPTLSSITLTKDAQGPNITLSNGNRSNYLLFSRDTFNPKIAIGSLGSIEANVSYNMDYADGVHRFYDATQNAVWEAINATGVYYQFAPLGAAADIWTSTGSQYLFTATFNANAVVSNGLTVGANLIKDKDGNTVGGNGNLLVGTANDGLHWRTYILGGTGASGGDLLVENAIGALIGGKRTTATATATNNVCAFLGVNGLTEVGRVQVLAGGETDSGTVRIMTKATSPGTLTEALRVTKVGNLLIGSTTDPAWRAYILGGTGGGNGDLLVENAIGAIIGGRRTASSAVADTNLLSIQGLNAGTEVARVQAVSGGATDSGALIFRVKATGVALAEAARITSTGNMGIGGSPNASALLDVQSTTKAFMPPRMTTTQRDAISGPTAGMVIYNTTTGKLNVRGAAAWEAVTSA